MSLSLPPKSFISVFIVNIFDGCKALLRLLIVEGILTIFFVFSGTAALAAGECSELFSFNSESETASIGKTYEYGGYIFSVRNMSQFGFKFRPSTSFNQRYHENLARQSKIVSEIGSSWKKSQFGEIRFPEPVGQIQNKQAFTMDLGLRVLDMPIKMTGSNEYRLPEELRPFAAEINKIVDHFHRIAPPEFARKTYAYITIDQGFVEKGNAQRKGGAHVDGFQGARIQPKNEVNYSYIASNLTPTAFYLQRFNLSKLDERVHDHFLEMDRQKKPESVLLTKEYGIYLMNAYTVHEVTEADRPGFRTFLRISFDVKEFDRLGNTHNPMFDYEWGMAPRETQSGLLRFQPLGVGLRKALSEIANGHFTKKSLDSIFSRLKLTDIELFYNFAFEVISLRSQSSLDLAVGHLSDLAKKDLRALRLLMVAAQSPVHTTAKSAFAEALKTQKSSLKENLFVDVLVEVQAFDEKAIDPKLWNDLTSGLSDQRVINRNQNVR